MFIWYSLSMLMYSNWWNFICFSIALWNYHKLRLTGMNEPLSPVLLRISWGKHWMILNVSEYMTLIIYIYIYIWSDMYNIYIYTFIYITSTSESAIDDISLLPGWSNIFIYIFLYNSIHIWTCYNHRIGVWTNPSFSRDTGQRLFHWMG